MLGFSLRTACGMAVLMALAGCVTTQPQPDGSTRVHLSLGGSQPIASQGGVPPAASQPSKSAAVAEPAQVASSTAVAASSIRNTAMAGLFEKHPYDGTAKTHFPRAAVTVIDWSRNDCWKASATIWWTLTKSEIVPPFSVCWGQSLGFAVNNAAHLQLFMTQTAFEHSGNVRNAGPKPPMLAVPDRNPLTESQQHAYRGFIQQLVVDTGWKPGAPTNIWLVDFDAKAAAIASVDVKVSPPKSAPMDSRAKLALERALSCTALGKSFAFAETALKQAGWQFDQGIAPVSLPQPVTVFGLSTRKIAVSRDGFEQTYRSHLQGTSLQQVIKAASLKLGKDGRTYGRMTKLGVLSAYIENGEVTLTCTVDVE